MASDSIHAPLTRDPRPAQYALGFSALEWQGYKALCARMQQSPDGLKVENNKEAQN
jgi:hypothetical protein